NRQVNQANPMVDARLPDGSRVGAVLPPVALDGPVLAIRKFAPKSFTLPELVDKKTLTEETAVLLAEAVAARKAIFISGGTGSGKTTLLNTLANLVPANERIITVEDAAELRIAGEANLVRLEARPPNTEGKGEITLRQLVRMALRLRPDRIIVGEVRGEEALDMLQAMNTGHRGAMSSGHANSAEDMLDRLETMALMAGIGMPAQAIRRQIGSALDLVVHLERRPDGGRQVTELIEVLDWREQTAAIRRIYTRERDQ
ncbi:MAG: Flp pilus assembly complex ATPase component TadA, partial [Clostridiales bacterium]|nr:Flp pilus assembly complex ATPase component TadA [Clostridiales bacterium]